MLQFIVHREMTDVVVLSRHQGDIKPRISNFLERWKQISSDPEILNVVLGYQIPLRCLPFQLSPPVTKFSDSSAPFIGAEVAKLLALGAIREVFFSEENFCSRLFLVPKKEGSYCPVIDLSHLNHFLENYHFQIENISCLKSLINHSDFMTSIDLKDAYLSVHIHKSSQKCLCFQWKNKSFAFQGLPFGLNTAPRAFTKLLKPVSAYLRKRGHPNNHLPG